MISVEVNGTRIDTDRADWRMIGGTCGVQANITAYAYNGYWSSALLDAVLDIAKRDAYAKGWWVLSCGSWPILLHILDKESRTNNHAA